MGTISKKIFSTVVTLSTVLSSVGVGAFAAPSVASAATLMNGDLIKASGPAVYYYGGDSKRYVFPNETTYKSWFADFSMVKTISDSELAAIQIGGNVTIRPGTKLVKITTDPKVYAVTAGGVLHWVESEAVALALFGSNWAQRVVDVPDAFFVNYSVPTGGSISTAVHPDGSVVSYAGSSDRYVVMGGMKRRVTDAGFSANMFQSGNVIQTSIVYPNGTDVTMRESSLSDAVMTSGSTTPTGGNLTVSLASDTPAAMVIPNNANNVMFTKVNLMAGSAPVTITGLKFRRVGVGITTDFSNVYLYTANGMRLTSGRTINSSSHVVEFNSLNLMIPAGQSMSLVVSADLNGRASGFVTGGQHAFELTDASSVVMSGTGSVSGSFPVRGNAMTIGTAQVARIDVQDGSEPANPRVGNADAEIANFKLVANGSNDVEVRRVTLYQGGSISNSDLSNLNLYQGGTLVAHADSVSNDGKIVLNFTTPFVIPNGQTRTFNLRGMVAGRSGRTIRIYTEYTTDVYAVDKVQNVGAEVCIATSSSPTCSGTYDGSSTTTSNASYSTTEGGQFTITYNGPATANVAKSQNDVVFYKFAITSGSNDIEVRRVNFAVTSTSGVLTDGTTDNLRDIKVKDADTGETVAGPVSLGSSSVAYKSFSPSTSFTVRAGQTRNFVITADTASSISSGQGFVFSLGGLTDNTIFGTTDLRVLSSGEFLTSGISPNTTVTGNTMTVQASSLSVSLSGTPSSGVAVKNQANIPTVAFMLSAGSQSDVRVTSLKVTGTGSVGGAYGAATLAGVVNSCGLFDAGVAVGNRMNPSSDGTMTFSGLNLNIARGASKSIEVRCSADSVITGTSGDSYAIGIAAVGDIAAQDTDGNTVTAVFNGGSVVANSATTGQVVVQTVKANGTLTVATNNLRQATILVAGGATWQNMAELKATAQYEDITIDYVAVTSTGTSANIAHVAVVQSDASGCASYTMKGDVRELPSGVAQMQEIDLSSSPIVVPKGSSTYICLMAQLAPIVSSSTNSNVLAAARSGNSISLGLAASSTSAELAASSVFNSSGYQGQKLLVRATGSASGERVYQSQSSNLIGNTFVVRKSKPVMTQQSAGLSTTLSAGQKTLYRAQIGSEGGDVAIKQLIFQVSVATTSNMTLGLFRIQKNGTDMDVADTEIIDAGATSTNLESASAVSFAAGSHAGTLNVVARFTNEEVLSGTGNTYALVATVGSLNSTTGDSITTNLVQQSLSSVSTGYLARQATLISSALGVYGISEAASPTRTSLTGAALLWSDMSETPHYSNFYDDSSNVSRDWTNEYLVNTISGSMVLSK